MALVWGIYAESGGVSPWEFDSVNSEAGNAVEISSDWSEEGTYSYKYTFGQSNDGNYAFKNFTDVTEQWWIASFLLNSSFSFPFGSALSYIMYLFDYDTSTVPVGIRIQGGSSAPTGWRITGTDLTQTDTSTNFSLGTKHDIKIYYRAGSGDGIVRVWIDGDLIFEDTSVNNTASPNTIRIGFIGEVPSSSSIAYFDKIEQHDSDPGAATGGATRFGGIISKALSGCFRRGI